MTDRPAEIEEEEDSDVTGSDGEETSWCVANLRATASIRR